MARNLLGLAAAGDFVCDRQFHGGRIAALAAAPRQRARPPMRRFFAHERRLRPISNSKRCKTYRVGSREKQVRASKSKDSLLRRKYVIPFVLACIILACNQATGINSIIAYNTTSFCRAASPMSAAHWGYVLFTFVNFLVTFGGVVLVDRKGRKFLLAIGTAGIIISLVCTGMFFTARKAARRRESAVQSMVAPDQKAQPTLRRRLSPEASDVPMRNSRSTTSSLVVIYSYGDFRAASPAVRSDDPARSPSRSIATAASLPTKWSRSSQIPSEILTLRAQRPAENRKCAYQSRPRHPATAGWSRSRCLLFMASFAIGPGRLRLAGTFRTDADAYSV